MQYLENVLCSLEQALECFGDAYPMRMNIVIDLCLHLYKTAPDLNFPVWQISHENKHKRKGRKSPGSLGHYDRSERYVKLFCIFYF